MLYELSCSSGVFFTALILTAWGQHDTDLNNLAYKTRCDSTVADAALRAGVEADAALRVGFLPALDRLVMKRHPAAAALKENLLDGQGVEKATENASR